MKWFEKLAMRAATRRALARVGVMESPKILEALSLAGTETVTEAVLNVAAGREEEARELCSVRGQSDADLRFNSGKLADAIEFQEELIALVEKARALKRGEKP